MTHRLRATLVAALVPTLVLSALWNWARDNSRSVPVETLPTAAETVEVPRPLTPILSVRRAADAMAGAAERYHRSDALIEVGEHIADQGCLLLAVDGVSLLDHRSDEMMSAGGAVPYLVAAALVDALGPDFVQQTTVLGTSVEGGTVGDLFLLGGGDPFLGTDELAGGPEVGVARLDALVDALAAAGISSVQGDIVGVDQRYPLVDRAPGAAPSASALIVDGGRILTSPVNRGLDPAQTAARTFDELLRRSGIDVLGTVRVGALERDAVPLAAVEGPSIVSLMNSVDGSDADVWAVAPWNWALEVGRNALAMDSLEDGLRATSEVIAGWGVPRPRLAWTDDPTGSSATCSSVEAAIGLLRGAGVELDESPIDAGTTGIEIDFSDGWVLAQGQTRSGASATAMGNRRVLLEAIAEVEGLLNDASTIPNPMGLGPRGAGPA